MTPPDQPAKQRRAVARALVVGWFTAGHRHLPWRDGETTAWGVLVSEIMLQQTPAARVAPLWRDWIDRWPTPADLAGATTADVLRAWGGLGYPRRALRLQESARMIVARHGGEVPDNEVALLALPGVGSYTAAAVAAFAFHRRSVVLDVNVRRVLSRLARGIDRPQAHETASERAEAWRWVPADDAEAALWAAASMELGAVICTARAPRCGGCPVAAHCSWLAAGRPAGPPARAAQPWQGTDRQCRGRIMAALRAGTAPVTLADVAWPDPEQRERCAAALVADGLASRTPAGLTLSTG